MEETFLSMTFSLARYRLKNLEPLQPIIPALLTQKIRKSPSLEEESGQRPPLSLLLLPISYKYQILFAGMEISFRDYPFLPGSA